MAHIEQEAIKRVSDKKCVNVLRLSNVANTLGEAI